MARIQIDKQRKKRNWASQQMARTQIDKHQKTQNQTSQHMARPQIDKQHKIKQLARTQIETSQDIAWLRLTNNEQHKIKLRRTWRGLNLTNIKGTKSNFAKHARTLIDKQRKTQKQLLQTWR
jgi:hypothetical protein